MKILYCLLALLLALFGCTPKPSSTIAQMQEKAVSGDVQSVNALFDKPQVNGDLTKQMMKKLESDPTVNLRLLPAEQVKSEIQDAINKRLWDVVDDEVKKGKDGIFAGMKVIKEELPNKFNSTVLVQLENGKQTTFKLSLVDKKWLITGLAFEDVIKNKIFHKISGKPSLAADKVKAVAAYVDQYQDDKLHALIKPELQKLTGSRYDQLILNLAVAGPITKDGSNVVIQGIAPHSGGIEEGIVVIDTATGTVSAAIMSEGNKVDRFSDIKDPDDYPEAIKNWNRL